MIDVRTNRRPDYKMTIEHEGRRFHVSVPAGFFDPFVGAIVEIDLDTLQSLGFVTTETLPRTLDLSAFTMVSPDKGFVVTHTEIVEGSYGTSSRSVERPASPSDAGCELTRELSLRCD